MEYRLSPQISAVRKYISQFSENQFQPECWPEPRRRGLSGRRARRISEEPGVADPRRVPRVAVSPRSTSPASRAGRAPQEASRVSSPLPRLPLPPSLPSPVLSLPPPSPRGGDRRACNLVPFARLEQHLPPSPGTRGSHPKPCKQPKTNPGPHANTTAQGQQRGLQISHSPHSAHRPRTSKPA